MTFWLALWGGLTRFGDFPGGSLQNENGGVFVFWAFGLRSIGTLPLCVCFVLPKSPSRDVRYHVHSPAESIAKCTSAMGDVHSPAESIAKCTSVVLPLLPDPRDLWSSWTAFGWRSDLDPTYPGKEMTSLCQE